MSVKLDFNRISQLMQLFSGMERKMSGLADSFLSLKNRLDWDIGKLDTHYQQNAKGAFIQLESIMINLKNHHRFLEDVKSDFSKTENMLINTLDLIGIDSAIVDCEYHENLLIHNRLIEDEKRLQWPALGIIERIIPELRVYYINQVPVMNQFNLSNGSLLSKDEYILEPWLEVMDDSNS